MILNGLADLFQQFFFNGGKHIENIRIMEIESRTVDIHFLYQFFYSNFFNTFFLHKFCKPGSKLGFCFADSPVSFFFHRFLLSKI